MDEKNRELRSDDDISESIDSVLAARRRASQTGVPQNTAGKAAPNNAVHGRRIQHAQDPRDARSVQQNPAPLRDGAAAPGRRIQPDMQRWASPEQNNRAQNAASPQRPSVSPPVQPERKTPAEPSDGALNDDPTVRVRQTRPVAPQSAKSSDADGMSSVVKNEIPLKTNSPAHQRIITPAPAAPASVSTPPHDDDIKIGGKKMRGNIDATRVTDMRDAVVPKAPTPKVKKAKESVDGSSVVTGIMRTVIYLVSVIVIAVVLSIVIINVGNDVFAFVKSDEVVTVEIPENATKEDVAEALYQHGVIKYKWAFKIYGDLKHVEDDFVAGEYKDVTPMMNYKELYSHFKKKAITGTTWVTIPEGYTVDEIIDLMLSYNIGGTKEDYVRAINETDYSSEFWFVEELEKNGYDQNRYYKLEGYLFPDTYEFYNASDAETVVRKMLKRFSEVYTDSLKTRAAELGMTTDQVVILASMIEKEAGSSSDFRNVSAVFHNRLAIPDTFPNLASDATVVYAIAHDRGQRPKEVTGEMMQYDSPYNTYTHQGYPPGAIANPGMNALKYALYPADNFYYYYFVSFPNGETVYASTAAEHEQNVARLRAMHEENSGN